MGCIFMSYLPEAGTGLHEYYTMWWYPLSDTHHGVKYFVTNTSKPLTNVSICYPVLSANSSRVLLLDFTGRSLESTIIPCA